MKDIRGRGTCEEWSVRCGERRMCGERRGVESGEVCRVARCGERQGVESSEVWRVVSCGEWRGE